MLFTTLRALAAARERLVEAFVRDHLDYPLLVQGDGSKTELLTRFRELSNAVLLGSASFWEGVDVPGDALQCVVRGVQVLSDEEDPMPGGQRGDRAVFDFRLLRLQRRDDVGRQRLAVRRRPLAEAVLPELIGLLAG